MPPKPRPQESISAAARALADSAAALSRALADEASSVGPQVAEAVAGSLREASLGLTSQADKLHTAAAGRPRGRRAEKVERTRNDLLDAAAGVFAAQGYEGASVGEIAAEAGYTKGALYAHFGSKQDLFHTLIDERLGVDEGAAWTWLTDDGVDEELLAQWITAAQRDQRRLLVFEVFLYTLRHPEDAGEVIARYRAELDRFAGRIAAVRGGDDRAVREVAFAAMSVINGVVVQGELLGDPGVSPEGAARQVARLFRSV